MTSPISSFVWRTRARTIKEVEAWRPSGENWIFRGQSDATWGLSTSLERELAVSPKNLKQASKRELGLVRRFQREAHHYLSYIPDDGNIPEWLAVMQHYGAPTRLLDWTHSFDIALFFATIDQQDKPSSVWAIDWKFMDKRLPKAVKDVYAQDRNCTQLKLFWKLAASGPGVAKLNSYRISQRHAVQQATFLAPLDVTKSFESNLLATLEGSAKKKFVRRLDIPSTLRAEIVKAQYRRNIHYGSLFPGIDGFAKSMSSMLLLPNLIHPGHLWHK